MLEVPFTETTPLELAMRFAASPTVRVYAAAAKSLEDADILTVLPSPPIDKFPLIGDNKEISMADTSVLRISSAPIPTRLAVTDALLNTPPICGACAPKVPPVIKTTALPGPW